MLSLAAFVAADLAWNNSPHVSTGMAPSKFDTLRVDNQE
jgi:hypothetical protein